MKPVISALFILMTSVVAIAQDGNKNMDVTMTREAFYPQGDQALYTYLFNNIKYSEEAKTAKVSGQVMIAFFVEKDSSLTEFRVVSDVGHGVADNVKEALKNLKYVPALVNGVPMRSKVILNVPVRAR